MRNFSNNHDDSVGDSFDRNGSEFDTGKVGGRTEKEGQHSGFLQAPVEASPNISASSRKRRFFALCLAIICWVVYQFSHALVTYQLKSNHRKEIQEAIQRQKTTENDVFFCPSAEPPNAPPYDPEQYYQIKNEPIWAKK